MNIIVAVNNNGYIGKDGALMWRCSDDLKNFKKLTMGGILIIGKTTFEQDLKKRMLPGRKTIVVGSGYRTLAQAVRYAYSLQNMTWDDENTTMSGEIWVIGGETIYNQLLPITEKIYLSVINDKQIGDRTFKVPENFRGSVIKTYFNPNPPK